MYDDKCNGILKPMPERLRRTFGSHVRGKCDQGDYNLYQSTLQAKAMEIVIVDGSGEHEEA